MTSTPTACPDCNNCGLPCLNEIHHPRQPDTSARDAAADAYATTKRKWSQDGERFTHEEHAQGIGLSICPSTAKAFRKGADWGHARALKETGVKLESAEEGERFYRREWESACERVDYAQEQLAAAQAKLKEFDEYYTFQNLERVEKQLAAAQGEIESIANRGCYHCSDDAREALK